MWTGTAFHVRLYGNCSVLFFLNIEEMTGLFFREQCYTHFGGTATELQQEEFSWQITKIRIHLNIKI